jgi:hypothetical protein
MLIRIIIGIVIIISIAVGGTFFTSYNNQQSLADSIEANINNDSANLKLIDTKNEKLEADIQAINKEIDDVLESLDKEENVLPDIIDSNSISKVIFDIGEESEIDYVPLSTSDWNDVKIGDNSYKVFKLKLELSGTEDNLVYFITQLQNESFPTLIIEQLTFQKGEPIVIEGEDVIINTGTINIAIYSK